MPTVAKKRPVGASVPAKQNERAGKSGIAFVIKLKMTIVLFVALFSFGLVHLGAHELVVMGLGFVGLGFFLGRKW